MYGILGGTAGNVIYGGNVNPPRNRKGVDGNPPPKDARASVLPDSLSEVIKELSCYIIGWRGYFGHCETPGALGEVDKWIRRLSSGNFIIRFVL